MDPLVEKFMSLINLLHFLKVFRVKRVLRERLFVFYVESFIGFVVILLVVLNFDFVLHVKLYLVIDDLIKLGLKNHFAVLLLLLFIGTIKLIYIDDNLLILGRNFSFAQLLVLKILFNFHLHPGTNSIIDI